MHHTQVKRRNRFRKLANNYKLLCGCKKCGYKDNAYALEFDHINPSKKLESISHLINKGRSKKIIKDEIRKCRVLCANCHAIHSRQQYVDGVITNQKRG